MTEEFAEELDKILSGSQGQGICKLQESVFDPSTLGGQLKRDGYGQWLAENSFRVFPQGYDFYKMGGYLAAISVVLGIINFILVLKQ